MPPADHGRYRGDVVRYGRARKCSWQGVSARRATTDPRSEVLLRRRERARVRRSVDADASVLPRSRSATVPGQTNELAVAQRGCRVRACTHAVGGMATRGFLRVAMSPCRVGGSDRAAGRFTHAVENSM